MKTWTPLHIELMLHYYTSGSPHRNSGASAVDEYTDHLVADGLLERVVLPPNTCGAPFRATKRGKAFVTLICRTPIPRSAFVDANGLEIKDA